jgi:hypothetical protein
MLALPIFFTGALLFGALLAWLLLQLEEARRRTDLPHSIRRKPRATYHLSADITKHDAA